MNKIPCRIITVSVCRSENILLSPVDGVKWPVKFATLLNTVHVALVGRETVPLSFWKEMLDRVILDYSL